MIATLEGVEFDGERIEPIKAKLLIIEADVLMRSVGKSQSPSRP
jgi:hypothetical protein